MNCPYCGKENPADLAVCSFCGGPLTEPGGPANNAPQTPPPRYEIVKPSTESPQSAVESNSAPSTQEGFAPTPAHPSSPRSGGLYGARVWWIVGCLVFICLLLSCIAAALAIYRAANRSGLLNPASTVALEPAIQVQSQNATATALPVSSLVPDVTLAVSTPSSPGLLFFDDFSKTSSGWEQVDEKDYSMSYYSGAYRMLVKTAMWETWSIATDESYGDVIVEVDATKKDGPNDNDFGLICRYKDENHFYYAIITSDGYYGIAKVSSDSTVILGSDYLEYSEVIQKGLADNHIRFDCVGENFTLTVNGQTVDQQTDGSYSTGNVGLIAGTYKNPGADILFDNFKISAP